MGHLALSKYTYETCISTRILTLRQDTLVDSMSFKPDLIFIIGSIFP